ncbi:hypothetical protein GALMADRAFT_138291 [Galerina marginata CBS 339.88]|uniref:Uncharacterized protein n=1 Tax=Galerina marginata (strain CBS 339.88) TaxID=685588 RepID=A0A067TGP8_GALM3|nr:hypothetical protein GALMADRAFT_138291 [Galerina marginata CBS 339.88]
MSAPQSHPHRGSSHHAVESVISESVSSFTSTIVPSSSQLPLHNSTTIPFSTAVVPHTSSATTSRQPTALTISISVPLGAFAVVIVSLVFLRWRKKKRQRTRLPQSLLPISETPSLGSVRPYITIQHSQTSNSALTLPTQPSSGSLAATSNTNSKARRWALTAEGTPTPLIVAPSAADSALQPLPDQNVMISEQLQAIQERLYQIESIARIAFVDEGVPPPEYASNRESSTRSGGDERGAGGVGGVARAVSQGASDGSGTLVGVERLVEE